MNVVTKDEFLTALRDGSYQQGFGALRKPRGGGGYGHCCLGVFCDLSEPDSWVDSGGYSVNTWAFGPSTLVSDESLQAFADILGFDHSQRMEFDAVRSHLMQMNDGTGTQVRRHTFAEIADWIEFEMDGFVAAETERLDTRLVLSA